MYTRVCRQRRNESERGEENGFVYCTPHTHYVRAHALTQQQRLRTYRYVHSVHTRAHRQVLILYIFR